MIGFHPAVLGFPPVMIGFPLAVLSFSPVMIGFPPPRRVRFSPCHD